MDNTKEKYKAPVAGREAVATPPRFNITELRPWETMFCDEKEYDTVQRGGITTSFVLIDVKSDAWFMKDGTSKKQHGDLFYEIMVENGVHLLNFPRTVYSDGCGSMVHVKEMALRLGINYIRIPPREQRLNEAERVCDRAFAAARVYITDNPEASLAHTRFAVDYVCYMKLRMATTESREWLTPYEIIKGTRPSIAHCVPFFTETEVVVPKEKRKLLKAKGMPNQRAEVGNMIGYNGMDMWGTTHKVLLDGNRVIGTRNATFTFRDTLLSGGC